MKDKQFETVIKQLKYEVLSNVARFYWDGTLLSNITRIPTIVVPGPKATMRCCIYKERAIVEERVRLAIGGDQYNKNIVEVIHAACDQCPFGGMQVTDICRGCLAHHCREVCPKDAITIDPNNRRAHIDKSKCINCGMCARACPYGAISNFRRPCEAACAINAIHAGEDGIAVIEEEKCTRCGACSYACPFGAIMDKSYILRCIDILKDPKNEGHRYLIIAPSIGTQFNYAKLGQVFTGMKKIGFDYLFEAALGADMVAYNEAKDLSEEGTCTSSCCPAFVRYIKTAFPEIADKISNNLSPMAAMCKFIKLKDPQAKTVFVGPCIAKKMEMFNKESAPFVDCVITFEELQALFGAKNIELSELEEISLDEASYFGRVFARSGGLSEAVAEALKEQNSTFEVKPVKCSGLAQCKTALTSLKNNRLDGNFIEGMACVNGCIGGPASLTHRLQDTVVQNAYSKKRANVNIKESLDAVNAPYDVAEIGSTPKVTAK